MRVRNRVRRSRQPGARHTAGRRLRARKNCSAASHRGKARGRHAFSFAFVLGLAFLPRAPAAAGALAAQAQARNSRRLPRIVLPRYAGAGITREQRGQRAVRARCAAQLALARVYTVVAPLESAEFDSACLFEEYTLLLRKPAPPPQVL